MTQQKRFLITTLIAILIGGAVAALVMTVISQAVKSQRAILDRDEATEFSAYVRGILTSDTLCTKFMNGVELPEGERPFQLTGAGYGEQDAADLGKGFKFAEDSLEIREFTFANVSENPVSLRVGAQNPRVVKRHIVRVKLALTNLALSSEYRPRVFEIPVLVNDSGKIETCNNESNPADACQSLGFRWDVGSSPPVCVPDTACVFGGSYVLNFAGTCKGAHAVTGVCQCPSGFKPLSSGAINISLSATTCKKGCDDHVLYHDTVVQCYRCAN